MQSDQNGYRVILAYVVLIAIILFMGKTRVGATLIYYGLVLILVFLVLTQFQFFASALAPFQQANQWLEAKPANTTPASTGGAGAGGSF